MEFMYRAGDPRRPSTGIVATLVNSESAATHVQGDYSGDGSGFHGENSEAVAPRPASDHGELRRQAVKERIRGRILREEAEALALEAEVWLELMEERIPLLRRPMGACACTCAKGSEGRAAPVAVLSSAKMLIGHEVGPKAGVPAVSPAKRRNHHLPVGSTVSAALSNKKLKPDLTSTVCGITVTGEGSMQEHLKGENHRRKDAKLAPTLSGAGHREVRSKPNASAALLPAKQKISRVPEAASTISAAASSEKQKQGLTCTLCGITATSEKGMQDHLKGKAHMTKAAAPAQLPPEEDAVEHGRQEETEEEGAYTPRKLHVGTNSGAVCEVVQMNGYLLCEVCDVQTADIVTMDCHLQGGKHIAKAKQQEEQSQAVVATADAIAGPEIETVAVEVNGIRRVDGLLLCELCDVKAASEIVMRSHLSGKKHASKQKATVDAGAGGKAMLAEAAKTDKDVAVGASIVDITVTPGQQAERAEVGDSNQSVVLDVGGMQHVVEKVDGFLLCTCCKVKAPSECVMRSHLVGKKHKEKRAKVAAAKSKKAASVVVDGMGRTEGQGNDESLEKPAAEDMEVVPPQQDAAAAPICASFSVAPMEVDEIAEAGDDTAKTEEEKVDAREGGAVETNCVAAVEVKIQVEGKVFTVLRQADSSLSCGLCGLHGCDKGGMLKHLYTREHWHRAQQNEEQATKAAQVVVSNDTVTDDGAAEQVKK